MTNERSENISAALSVLLSVICYAFARWLTPGSLAIYEQYAGEIPASTRFAFDVAVHPLNWHAWPWFVGVLLVVLSTMLRRRAGLDVVARSASILSVAAPVTLLAATLAALAQPLN